MKQTHNPVGTTSYWTSLIGSGHYQRKSSDIWQPTPKLQKTFGTRIDLLIRKTLDHVLPLLLFDQIKKRVARIVERF